ncbi:MAG: glycosyltransferase [Acidobacteria bacterium]|nr:glycosyltransferase [Acidobacteriota bacterium]
MGRPRIGYLVKSFPVVSETFILNEVRAMALHGVPLVILALKPPPRTVVHRAATEIESTVRLAPWYSPLGWPALVLDHLRLWQSDRKAYRRVFDREVGRYVGSWTRQPSTHRWQLVRKRLRRFAWAGWVARRTRQLGIRHLHAHYAGEPLRVAHLVKRLVGVPYSFTAHAKDLYLAPESRLRRRLGTASFAVGCHRHGVETMRRLLPERDRGKVRFIRHGIDLDLFTPPEREEPGEETAEPVILAVGRLTAKKGFDDLIDACRMLARRGVPFHLDILGDGSSRAELEAQVRHLDLTDRVTFHGFVAQESLPEWYHRAAVFAAPSKELADGNRDGIPNVLLEAMASKLPLVASVAAGIPEVVEHEVSGLLTVPGEPAPLATALARLLEDRQLARRLGRQALRQVDDLDFRRTNEPLARELGRALERPVDAALDEAERLAWAEHGLATQARKRLGIEPRQLPDVEAAIRRAVAPGIRANAWRPDLVRLAGRRLWDEIIKARRLPQLASLLLGAGRGRKRILDLGCGRGGLSVAMRAHGLDATALDLRFRNCSVTRLRGERYGLSVPAVSSVGERLPFTDGSFDAVACLEVLEHVRDPRALLGEIRRVLAPDGRCVVTVINRWAHFDPHYHLFGLNFLPARLANRYIDLRRRTKISYRDCQTLDEMHYYSYAGFLRLARETGYRVRDPERPVAGWRRWLQACGRYFSLGFNTLTLVLEPEPVASPLTACRPGSPETHPTAAYEAQRSVA